MNAWIFKEYIPIFVTYTKFDIIAFFCKNAEVKEQKKPWIYVITFIGIVRENIL